MGKRKDLHMNKKWQGKAETQIRYEEELARQRAETLRAQQLAADQARRAQEYAAQAAAAAAASAAAAHRPQPTRGDLLIQSLAQGRAPVSSQQHHQHQYGHGHEQHS